MVLLKGVGAKGFRFFTNLRRPRPPSSPRRRGRRWWSTGASSTAKCAFVAPRSRCPTPIRPTTSRAGPATRRSAPGPRHRVSPCLTAPISTAASMRPSEVRRLEGPSPAVLGRVRRPSGHDRVLAGSGGPASRPLSLHAGWRGLDARAARSVTPSARGQADEERSSAKESSSSRSSKWSSALDPAPRRAHPHPGPERRLERLLGPDQRRLLVGVRDDLRPRLVAGRPWRAARSRAPTTPGPRPREPGARRASAPRAWRIARPWPSLSSPPASSSRTLVRQVEQPDQVRDRGRGCGRAAGPAPPWRDRDPRPVPRRLAPRRPG